MRTKHVTLKNVIKFIQSSGLVYFGVRITFGEGN